jgi:hypothetical protein
MKEVMKARVAVVICGLVLGLPANSALGTEDRVFTSNINPQAFSDQSHHYLDLTGTGNDTIEVHSPNLGEDEWIIVWFAAECAVAAADTRTWVNIDILVDNVQLPPTDENNAFCTSNGTSGHSWVSAATHGAFLDLANNDAIDTPYEIQVRARLVSFNPGERWTIGDLSLMIFVGP